jgi:hypothetical protein
MVPNPVINQSTLVDWFMKVGNFAAYYRVSTQKQGKSGLGLEAQQAAVANHLNGGNWRIVAEFTEVESGKRKDRPKTCRRSRGVPRPWRQACHCEAGQARP